MLVLLKGGLISESFFYFDSILQKKVPNQVISEQFLFRWIVLRAVIWHLFFGYCRQYESLSEIKPPVISSSRNERFHKQGNVKHSPPSPFPMLKGLSNIIRYLDQMGCKILCTCSCYAHCAYIIFVTYVILQFYIHSPLRNTNPIRTTKELKRS